MAYTIVIFLFLLSLRELPIVLLYTMTIAFRVVSTSFSSDGNVSSIDVVNERYNDTV